jgi:EAL domain-containing protein (putative c-di-GMP-specific phosphodiesterase class I)
MPLSNFLTTAARAAHLARQSIAPGDAQELRAQAARSNATERRRITNRLRQALEQHGFVLLYQVQLNLKSGLTQGAEATIRLHHRRRGLILPSHFMPVAELSDIVIEIGNWILQQACEDASQWTMPFAVSIQISHRQLLTGTLVTQVIKTLSHTNLAPGQLLLALTEAMLIDDSEDTTFALKALRGLGVGLVLDNFGTSYTSFSLLKRLPLTTLKLDRAMIQDLPGDHENVAILRATIETAHALGIRVIADGVDTEDQRRLLDNLGCDAIQGPYLSQPLTFGALNAKLNLT